MRRPTASTRERDPDSAAAFSWLSFAGAALFAVLLAVHLANKPGLWSHRGAPAKSMAQPAAPTERSPS